MTKTDKFMKAIKVVFRNEGGYVDHPNDPGGKTNMGITEATLKNAVRYGITSVTDVKKLTRGICEDIYFQMYWNPCKAESMMDSISLVHFDCAINCGTNTANKLLQRTINKILSANVLTVDGIIGKNTLSYLEKVSSSENNADRVALVYCSVREDYYRTLTLKKPKMKVFLKGWLNRVKHLREIIKEGY